MKMLVVVVIALCSALFGQAKQDVDLIVSGGIVVTMDRGADDFRRWQRRDQGRRDCGGGVAGRGRESIQSAQTIDARGRLVLPGFINGHTHVPMTLFRGLHDDVTLQ